MIEGRVPVVRGLVLLPCPVDVVGMDVPAPRVRVREPFLRLDTDEIADLRADVDRLAVLVDGVEVDDRGDVLDGMVRRSVATSSSIVPPTSSSRANPVSSWTRALA
jgi:hypothetical protein